MEAEPPGISTSHRARGRACGRESGGSAVLSGDGIQPPGVKIFKNKDEAVVQVPYVEHYPPDTNAALAWLSRRQPEKWKDRQEVNITGSVAHRLAQMTPEERGAFALDLAERARQRLVEAGVIIEHKPEPALDDQPEAEPEE